jgi:hypothetical protein
MSVMDFTPSGWAATYDPSKSEGHVSWRSVERWDESEHGEILAMVVDESRGRLTPASSLRGFEQLVPTTRVLGGFSAAPGWQLKLWDDDKDDSTAYLLPIAAWIVDARGAVSPVPLTSDRSLEPSLNQRSEIIAPE